MVCSVWCLGGLANIEVAKSRSWFAAFGALVALLIVSHPNNDLANPQSGFEAFGALVALLTMTWQTLILGLKRLVPWWPC